MKKAAIYMRVSTQRQEEEQTIESQRTELLKRIEEDGNTLMTDCIYSDDGWSGAIIERPEMDRMRSDAANEKFEILYFYDRGRISRIFVHQEIILGGLKELGVECVSLHDINGKSDEEILMGSVMGIFHEYERLKITERMRIGKMRKVKENHKLLGYIPKYGYSYLPRIKNGPNERDGKFIINKEQAKIVRKIFEWYSEGKSKYWVREKLHELGISPPQNKNALWSLSVLDRLVRDSTYMGKHYYNKSESVVTKNPRKLQKYRRTVKGSRKTRPKKEWLLVEIDPIVSEELFTKVKKQLMKNKRLRSNNKKNNYLVGGLIECACGFARTGDPANGCLYYRCNDRLNNVAKTRKCFLPSVNATVLDGVVWDSIHQLLTNPELVIEHAKKWQKGVSPVQNEIEERKKRLSKLDEEEMRYSKMYGEGVMSENIYKENIASINIKRSVIIDDVKGLQDELTNKPTLPLEKLVEGVLKLVDELDFSKKHSIIQKVVTKIVATKEEVQVWGYLPVLANEEIGLNVKYRYCWFAKCW